jgi:hypothetical protein
MRTMLQPARHSLFELPTTYCELDEPSSPWTMIAVAVAENLACDLVYGRGRDLDQLWVGSWKSVDP